MIIDVNKVGSAERKMRRRRGGKERQKKKKRRDLWTMEGIDVVSVVLPDVQHHYTAFFEAARSPFLSSFGRCVDVTATKQIPLPKTRNARNSDRSGFNCVL